MHWNVGMWLLNGMAGPTMGVDAWITHNKRFASIPTSAKDGDWPPRPTGTDISITPKGATSVLAGGVTNGDVAFFTDPQYGMNWVFEHSLGDGAEVAAFLPHNTAPEPFARKAVLFHYPAAAKLANDAGHSPALRIGFPPFHYAHGTDPTCEELSDVGETCVGCSVCVRASAMEKLTNPM